MTDHDPPEHRHDDPEVDDDALARVAELLATPVVTPTSAVRDRQVAAAVAARRAPDEAQVAVPPVRRPNRVVRVLAIAAAVIAVAVLTVTLVTRTGPRATQTATSAARPKAAASSAGTAAGPGVDLGSFTSADALVRDFASRARTTATGAGSTTTVVGAQPLSQPPGSTAAGSPAVPTATSACDATVRAGRPNLGPLVLDGRARLSGTDVEVLVYQPAGETARVIAVVPGTCRVTLDRPA